MCIDTSARESEILMFFPRGFEEAVDLRGLFPCQHVFGHRKLNSIVGPSRQQGVTAIKQRKLTSNRFPCLRDLVCSSVKCFGPRGLDLRVREPLVVVVAVAVVRTVDKP